MGKGVFEDKDWTETYTIIETVDNAGNKRIQIVDSSNDHPFLALLGFFALIPALFILIGCGIKDLYLLFTKNQRMLDEEVKEYHKLNPGCDCPFEYQASWAKKQKKIDERNKRKEMRKLKKEQSKIIFKNDNPDYTFID